MFGTWCQANQNMFCHLAIIFRSMIVELFLGKISAIIISAVWNDIMMDWVLSTKARNRRVRFDCDCDNDSDNVILLLLNGDNHAGVDDDDIDEDDGPLTRYVKCGLRMRRECRERFPRHGGLAIPTYITARAWRCMPESLTTVSFEVGGGENVPGIPGSCATRNFTYLVRGPR